MINTHKNRHNWLAHMKIEYNTSYESIVNLAKDDKWMYSIIYN